MNCTVTVADSAKMYIAELITKLPFVLHFDLQFLFIVRKITFIGAVLEEIWWPFGGLV